MAEIVTIYQEKLASQIVSHSLNFDLYIVYPPLLSSPAGAIL